MAQDDRHRRAKEHSAYLRVVSEPTNGHERHVAASALRNLPPILSVLEEHLPSRGRALEVASGTGQHVAAFAARFPAIAWQPSDPDPAARASIAAWSAEAGVDNIAAALALDVTQQRWWAGLEPGFDAIVAINLLHIAPWSATLGLMAGAAELLGPAGLVYIYGCFMREGAHTAPSNAAFDASLRAQNPAWGVRDMEAVAQAAASHGLRHVHTIAMPANNFSLIFRRL